MRRPVKAGILFTALTRVLGAPREMTDHDVERWSSGPPVEVLEAGTGPAFVVVGGRRLPLRGLPLPYLVSTDDMLLFPEGEELNVAAPARTAPPVAATRARDVIEKERRGPRQRQARARPGRGRRESAEVADRRGHSRRARRSGARCPRPSRAGRAAPARVTRTSSSRARSSRSISTRMPSGSIGSIVQPAPVRADALAERAVARADHRDAGRERLAHHDPERLRVRRRAAARPGCRRGAAARAGTRCRTRRARAAPATPAASADRSDGSRRSMPRNASASSLTASRPFFAQPSPTNATRNGSSRSSCSSGSCGRRPSRMTEPCSMISTRAGSGS